MSFFIIQFINKISLKSEFINYQKSILEIVAYLIEKNHSNDNDDLIKDIENIGLFKIKIQGNNDNKKDTSKFSINTSNIEYKKT